MTNPQKKDDYNVLSWTVRLVVRSIEGQDLISSSITSLNNLVDPNSQKS